MKTVLEIPDGSNDVNVMSLPLGNDPWLLDFLVSSDRLRLNRSRKQQQDLASGFSVGQHELIKVAPDFWTVDRTASVMDALMNLDNVRFECFLVALEYVRYSCNLVPMQIRKVKHSVPCDLSSLFVGRSV